ncbi:MAG: hypothetical protein PHQ74_02680 [Crocinitomicaceae bacterium]|nr:hypothetical protein [Crocinitomicaceae bacterium]
MAKQGEKRSVYVYADWQGMANPLYMGILQSVLLRGKDIDSNRM